MSEVIRVFRPHWMQRTWYLVVAGVLIWTCVMAPVGLYLAGLALFSRVVLRSDGLARGPFRGAARFDEIARWGRYVYRKDKDRHRRTLERIDWVYVVVQTHTGAQFHICLEDFVGGPDIETALREHVGPASGPVAWRWLAYGPRFSGDPE